MTYDEAKRILHPDTTVDAISEMEVVDENAKIAVVTDACLKACDAIDKVLSSSRYLVEKKACCDDKWYYEGVWNDPVSLAKAMFEVGRTNSNISQIRITEIGEAS